MLISMKWQGRKCCVLRAHNSIKWRPAALPHHARVQPRSLDHSKRTSTPAWHRVSSPLLSPYDPMRHLHALQFTVQPSGLGTSAGNCPLCFRQRSLMPVCHCVCVCCTLMSCAQLHVNLLLHFAGSFFACHFSALADSCWTLSISCTGCLATWRSKGNYWIWGKAWVKDKCSHSCNSTWQMYCREFNMQWHGGNLTLASLKYAWQLHIIP